MASIVEAQSLARYYKVKRGPFSAGITLRALDGVSFALEHGQTLAVVGESGCGKSTLARQITLIETPTAGSLRVEGRDVATANKRERRQIQQKVQIVFQDPFGSLNPRKKVGAILEETAGDQHVEQLGGTCNQGPRNDGACGLAPRALQPLPTHVLWRPTPTYCHCTRVDAQPIGGGCRRAGIGAGRLHPSPSAQLADRPAGGVRTRVYLSSRTTCRSYAISRTKSWSCIWGAPSNKAIRPPFSNAPCTPTRKRCSRLRPTWTLSNVRQRVPLKGEIPSPLDPPPGCAFNTRCPYATDECKHERPALRSVHERLVACHHAENING